MFYAESVNNCCGITELSNVELTNDFNLSLDQTFRYLNPGNGNLGSHIVWTTTRRFKHKGEALAKLFKKHKLGTVQKTRKSYNPNSNNNVIMWILTPTKKMQQKFVSYLRRIDDDLYY